MSLAKKAAENLTKREKEYLKRSKGALKLQMGGAAVGAGLGTLHGGPLSIPLGAALGQAASIPRHMRVRGDYTPEERDRANKVLRDRTRKSIREKGIIKHVTSGGGWKAYG